MVPWYSCRWYRWYSQEHWSTFLHGFVSMVISHGTCGIRSAGERPQIWMQCWKLKCRPGDGCPIEVMLTGLFYTIPWSMQFWPSLISIRKWFSKHRSRQDPESSCKMRNMHHGCGIANNMPGGTCMKRAKTSNRFGIIKNLEFHFLTGSLLQPRIASLLCWCREWPSRIFPGRSWFPVAETCFFPPLGLAGLAARCHDSNGIHRWIRIAINSWFTVDSRLFVARLPGKYIYII